MTRAIMRLDNVSFEVDGCVLLQPTTLELPARGTTGLVGQNGSGKSTLLRVLARQQTAFGGEVLFNERPLSAWREREFARRVAYLPQYTPLAAGLRARELVELGRYPWHGALGRFSAADTRKVDEALSLTDTEGLADRMVDSLSGGERQRVWLAMLLAQDTRLLLLDEPLSALDPAHQVGILSLIRRISHEQDRAVLIVLHDINLAARYCDHILALQGGRLIAQGPPAELMTPERLSQVYDVDMGVSLNPDAGGMIAYVRA